MDWSNATATLALRKHRTRPMWEKENSAARHIARQIESFPSFIQACESWILNREWDGEESTDQVSEEWTTLFNSI